MDIKRLETVCNKAMDVCGSVKTRNQEIVANRYAERAKEIIHKLPTGILCIGACKRSKTNAIACIEDLQDKMRKMVDSREEYLSYSCISPQVWYH